MEKNAEEKYAEHVLALLIIPMTGIEVEWHKNVVKWHTVILFSFKLKNIQFSEHPTVLVTIHQNTFHQNFLQFMENNKRFKCYFIWKTWLQVKYSASHRAVWGVHDSQSITYMYHISTLPCNLQ